MLVRVGCNLCRPQLSSSHLKRVVLWFIMYRGTWKVAPCRIRQRNQSLQKTQDPKACTLDRIVLTLNASLVQLFYSNAVMWEKCCSEDPKQTLISTFRLLQLMRTYLFIVRMLFDANLSFTPKHTAGCYSCIWKWEYEGSKVSQKGRETCYKA